jgi:DNA repair exonuclease SbcCD nuclease subunit
MINETQNQKVNRVWILGDLHLGIRSNSMEWLNIQSEFLDNHFLPTVKQNFKEGDVLVQVGDVFDNRQSINTKILNYAINFFERVGNILPTYLIAGNHDIWAKKSNDISSIECLKWIPNIQILKEPQTYNWGGKNVLLMPWRRDSEHEIETLNQYSHADIVFCHSEVKGAYTNQRSTLDDGTEIQNYNGYKRVYSGHIHYRQEHGVLKMVGTPYQLTRSDINNQKGFDLVDLNTMDEYFFENTVSPKFLRFNLSKLYNITLNTFKNQIYNNFVDLYVPSKVATTTSLSYLINKIQSSSRTLEPNIYQEDSYIDKDFEDINDLQENYDIMSLCKKYVNDTNYDQETKDKIKNKLKKLYQDCLYNNK